MGIKAVREKVQIALKSRFYNIKGSACIFVAELCVGGQVYTDFMNFYVLLTVQLSIILDNDQFDTHLPHFTLRLL